MAELERLQSQHAELFKQLDSKVVKQNNEKDHARFLNLLKIKGPDSATMRLLTEQADGWNTNPLSFWGRPVLKALDFGHPPHLNSQAQMVGCYMQARRDSV